MNSADSFSNSVIDFRPAKHCAWIIGAVQLWNAFDLAWHNRLHIDPRDLEILKNIPKDSGLLLAANHSDEMDPRVCIELFHRAHLRFTTMINAEAFDQWHGFYGKLLQRLGGFSIERGGNDQAARRYSIDMIKKGHGALVMFPEGEISYLNDLVQPFKTGVVHLGLQAITETRPTNSSWTAYLVPVAIKYYYRKPIGPILDKKIRAMEQRLFIPANSFTLQAKIIRIMAKILNCPELLNSSQSTSEQLTRLKKHISFTQVALLSEIETKYPKLQTDPKAPLVDRAQKMIFFLREQLARKKLLSPEARTQLQNSIRDLKKIIQRTGWQPQYIDLAPSQERLAETVMKLEREVFNLKTPSPLGNRNVLVRIGPPIDLGRYVEQYQKDPSTLSHQIVEVLHDNIQSMISS